MADDISWKQAESERVYHPASNLFRLMDEEEYAGLKADIAANGLNEPIVLHIDGSILDGRNRHRACLEIGLQPRFMTWDNHESPVTFVISQNLKRRHLTSSERAVIALDALPMLEAEARGRMLAGVKPDPNQKIEQGMATEQAAQLFQTNRQYVSDAKKLAQQAPDLLDEIRQGQINITQAKRQLKERKREKAREKNRELVEKADVPQVATKGQRFQTIVLDPPWDWGDEGDCDQFGRARPIYDTMSIDEIAALPVGKLAEDNAHIYLWITNRSLPKGFVLLEKWGFRYITMLTWCKPHFGMGNYFRGATEHILFGVKGSLLLLRHDVGTWFEAARPGQHSSKPPEFYELVEGCSPGPWLEMFARGQRPGWVAWGAESG